MFEFDLKDDFKKELVVLSKKSPIIANAVNKKINEIIHRDKNSINMYKNLKHSAKGYKRVHVTSRLIMLFSVDYENNYILFTYLMHRDKVYKEI